LNPSSTIATTERGNQITKMSWSLFVQANPAASPHTFVLGKNGVRHIVLPAAPGNQRVDIVQRISPGPFIELGRISTYY
jgi:hypothetical protein